MPSSRRCDGASCWKMRQSTAAVSSVVIVGCVLFFDRILFCSHVSRPWRPSQLWHMGRASHSSYHEGGALPVAPSALPIAGDHTHDATGTRVPYETPRALELDEIPSIVASVSAPPVLAVTASGTYRHRHI